MTLGSLTNSIVWMQEVLRYMHARPELLPQIPQPNSSAPDKRQLSAGHARARAALPKKAFCDSQAGCSQLLVTPYLPATSCTFPPFM